MSGRRRWFALPHGCAAKSMLPKIKMIAFEPANAADAAQSFRAGRLICTEKKFTIADGLRTNVGAPNFPIIQRYMDDIVTVSEEAIVLAMRTILGDDEIVIEPSAARSVCGNLGIKGQYRGKTRGHHSHRRQCRSRRVAVGGNAVGISRGDVRTAEGRVLAVMCFRN